MRESIMQNDWRTVQIFLDKNFVSEVEVNSANNVQVRCTCPSFGKVKRCNHVKFVKTKMLGNDGHYSIHIPEEVDEELVTLALSDAEMFRQFIIDYGKVEVID